MSERLPEFMAVMRTAVNASEPFAAQMGVRRNCPSCGKPCSLSRGAHSNRWFWSHVTLSDCQFDHTGCRIHFHTSEQAQNAEQIFQL